MSSTWKSEGHFAVCFKSKRPKNRSGTYCTDRTNQATTKTDEDCYAFVIKGGSDSSGVVDLCVGGVLIDSGETCNIVDRATWESLKQKWGEMPLPEMSKEAVCIWPNQTSWNSWNIRK